jgi:hypothetical protein
VRCWTILKGMLGPQAAGMIHTDLNSLPPPLLLLLLLLPPLLFSSYVRCFILKGTLAPQAAGDVLAGPTCKPCCLHCCLQVRCWTILKGTLAPQAAGVIHTDFERGFIKAEVVSFDDFKR